MWSLLIVLEPTETIAGRRLGAKAAKDQGRSIVKCVRPKFLMSLLVPGTSNVCTAIALRDYQVVVCKRDYGFTDTTAFESEFVWRQ